ncbi:Uma2 family endonuclease [Alienimonas chondri]|uniref:Putative restriction endonuclease domain-containing protein n=1 Tax=Alienimonas chondri TaxID=2681879 RepID=A0ABX1VFX2_9PLAN|nr:Uma2 family endonuclease [Alienimonas chondri]NNJ27013.1 hypothetical protein [Alienimonas chondri]
MVTRSQTAPPKPDAPADPRPIAVPGTTGVTLAEFREMRDAGPPTELVCGEIVEVPRPVHHHGAYCSIVTTRLTVWTNYFERGHVLSNDTGYVVQENPDTLRGPDVIFISKERLGPQENYDLDDWLRIPPELAVEVKSPSDSWPQTRAKAVEYLQSGVAEVWVLDGPTRQLRVHRDPENDPLTLAESDELTSPALPGFACKVADLLAVG